MWTVSLPSLRRGLGTPSTVLARRSWTSSSALSSASGSSSGSAVNLSLKRLIQPFVLKCHPDMARQQGLPETARKVNLAAIQNLNSYMDGVHKWVKNSSSSNGQYPFPSEGHTVEIEFVISMAKQPADSKPSGDSSSINSNHNKKNNQHVVSSSRRKFELLVPPMNTTPVKVKHHVTRQLLRLLRISDLPAPANLSLLDDDDYDYDYDNEYDNNTQDPGASGNDGSKQQQQRQRQRRKMTPWEESRERFWKRHNRTFDHKKFNRVYREALHDAEVHLMTRNWIRDNPRLRNQLLAKILSNVKFKESISPLERLVAYRRLMRFLDENFDDLRLEDAGRYWEEQTTLLVAESRPYNLSSSALRKRRNKNQHMDTGYSFTIHHDNKVTVTIPADFDNNELLQELLRNMVDFMQIQGTGLDGDFYSAMYGQD
mmetsp:Transcript_1325/g.2977  ORF Transcript_1325/g.2977 Transcript_1325/m.2977 type:complete len:428 (+) Transcript_1325:134-1417(+)